MKILTKTRSICPVCNNSIDAQYIEQDGKVFMEKKCPEHGSFKTLAASSVEDYLDWIDNPMINIPPKVTITKATSSRNLSDLPNPVEERVAVNGAACDGDCPHNCGVCENHMQTACCIVIDITERCNQHCPYCFARADEKDFSGYEPTLSELETKLDKLLELGEEERPFNLQFSGGEPTVRQDLPEIIKVAKDKGFEYIQINTNGRRIAREEGYAEILKEAGASVIFMQFDGTTDEIYMQMRGEPLLEEKKKAIENCRKAGLPVTLVPTVARNVNLDNIGDMMKFVVDNVSVVKGIHFQPVSFFGRHPDPNHENRVTMFDVMRELEAQTGIFKYKDFAPIATGHTLCCFYSTYIKETDGKSVRCTLTKAKKDAGISCCEDIDIIKKDRDFVLNKWEVASREEEADKDWSKYNSSAEILDLIDFLTYYRQNTFTVTGMAFQDASNLDTERVKRCRVQVLSPDDRLIPFCAYNTIYRK